MIIAATGHRPDKLGGYGLAAFNVLMQLAYAYLAEERPEQVISGMALGWDQAFAAAALHLSIPVHAAIPFAGQESAWPMESQRTYNQILLRCASKTIVMPGGYCAYSMQVRNQWMVDRCGKVAAMWDGTKGGTANCVKYAEKVGRPIDNLYARWAK